MSPLWIIEDIGTLLESLEVAVVIRLQRMILSPFGSPYCGLSLSYGDETPPFLDSARTFRRLATNDVNHKRIQHIDTLLSQIRLAVHSAGSAFKKRRYAPYGKRK